MKAKELLTDLARKALEEHFLASDFSQDAFKQLERIKKPYPTESAEFFDLSSLPWCSIDNDDSRDLDQLTCAELKGDKISIYVAVADVDALVHLETPLDLQAQINTTSIYTAAKVFPMLPEKLSTNLTSLNENQTRAAIVFEMLYNNEGELLEYKIYRSAVFNHAKLTYSGVGPWLEGRGEIPTKINEVVGLAQCLQWQDQLAQKIKKQRHNNGALTLYTTELKAIFHNDDLVSMVPIEHNRAHELIENLMIAANTASARYMAKQNLPSLRRVVRQPERWDRIVEFASQYNYELPDQPNSKALDQFLRLMRKQNRELFSDISITIVKLLGSGEYIVEGPEDTPVGHFGLALDQYSHSTAPNRRYPDLITQRLLKFAIAKKHQPYSRVELERLAQHCSEQEDTASKVERQILKSAAAILLSPKINTTFNAIVTGASIKGTWVRLYNPPIEGKLILGTEGLDIGDRIRAKLVNVDIARGFIDFIRVEK